MKHILKLTIFFIFFLVQFVNFASDLKTDMSNIDLKQFKVGEVKENVFKVFNTTSKTINLKSIKTGCGCISAKLEKKTNTSTK